MVKEVFMLVGVVGVAGGAIGQPQISDLGFQFWRLGFQSRQNLKSSFASQSHSDLRSQISVFHLDAA